MDEENKNNIDTAPDEDATKETDTREAEASAAELSMKDQNANIPKKKSLGREILEWVLVIVIAVGAALIIRNFVFEPVRVDGASMRNTLQDGEYMIVTKYQYLFNDPERFDVVICHYPGRGSTNFVKRIVGIPGDVISVRDGTLYVNGEAIDEPYIDFRPTYNVHNEVVLEGQYFVLGDNRANSNDSHVNSVGQLTREQIIGKVRLVAWPFSVFRVIK